MPSGNRLEGKTALITGAARGTGAAIAKHFIAEGAHVLLTDVRDELGESVAAELGDSARYARLDVTSEDEWKSTLAALGEQEGGLDILVNNAAILLLQPIDQDVGRRL